MPARPNKKHTAKPMTRVSVSFPPELYGTLEKLANQQKVSVAWIVRDAAEKYVTNRWPLLDSKR